LRHLQSISARPSKSLESQTAQRGIRSPGMSSTVPPPDSSPIGSLNDSEKTRPVSPGTHSPTPRDGKDEADRHSLSPSVQQAPAATRSTFASICIVAACTSAQLTSIGLGPAYAISVPYAGNDLHIQKEDYARVRKCNAHHLGPTRRHVSFFSVDDWRICTAANECGLLDT